MIHRSVLAAATGAGIPAWRILDKHSRTYDVTRARRCAAFLARESGVRWCVMEAVFHRDKGGLSRQVEKARFELAQGDPLTVEIIRGAL